VQLPFGPWINTANLLLEQQFGDDRESGATAFGYAWQSLLPVTADLGVGFEAFGEIEQFATDPPELSEQEHRIGPVGHFATGLGDLELSLAAGFLFGLTDETPDRTFKFDVEIGWGGGDEDAPGEDDD